MKIWFEENISNKHWKVELKIWEVNPDPDHFKAFWNVWNCLSHNLSSLKSFSSMGQTPWPPLILGILTTYSGFRVVHMKVDTKPMTFVAKKLDMKIRYMSCLPTGKVFKVIKVFFQDIWRIYTPNLVHILGLFPVK